MRLFFGITLAIVLAIAWPPILILYGVVALWLIFFAEL
jgi:hypothetical protein